MKQRTNTTTVETNIQDRQAFTIKATGKAFRSLIDGIYSNKILAPVRELMTNAHDAHLMAGNEDTPFSVTVPTHMQPEFVVRDYGIGMDHETVTGLYTTLFDSSKDDTNSQVGMLGLGSKSPFAYTDTFTVTCYDGETKRVYNAHLDNDVPQLGLLWQGESDDPRGVEVKFPVRSGDYGDFLQAIKRVALGFDTKPDFGDTEVEDRPVLHEGNGYRVFSRDDGYYSSDPLAAVNVRMGCVVYPVANFRDTEFDTLSLPRQVAYVIDVPIGTSDVTTNREALADDEQSRAGIKPFLNATVADHRDTVTAAYNAAKSKLEKAKVLSTIDYEWRRAFNLPMQLMVSLMNEGWDTETIQDTLKRRRPGFFVECGDKRRTLAYEHRYDSIGRVEVILDDDVTVRRRSRVKDHLSMTNATVYVVPAGHAKVAVPRLKALWGLSDEQFTKVEDLPDPGPRERTSNGARASKTEQQAALDGGKPWVNRMRKNYNTTSYGNGGIHRYHEDNLMDNAFARKVLGIPESEFEETPYWKHQELWNTYVVMLTDKQVEALEPDTEQSLGRVLRKAWGAADHTEVIREFVLFNAVREALNSQVINFDGQRYSHNYWIADQILEAEGAKRPEISTEIQAGLWMVEGVHLQNADDQRKYRPAPGEVKELVAALRRQYPALFRLDQASVSDYIQSHGS